MLFLRRSSTCCIKNLWVFWHSGILVDVDGVSSCWTCWGVFSSLSWGKKVVFLFMSLKVPLPFFVKHRISTDYHLLVVGVVQLLPFCTWIIIDEDESLTLVIKFNLFFSRLRHEHELYSLRSLSERYKAFFHSMLLVVSFPIHFLSEIDWTDKLHTPQLLPKILLAVSYFWACFEPHQGLFYFLFPPHHSYGVSWNS